MAEQEQAETVALQALGWLAGDADLFGQFLGATGASAGDIAQQAQDPVFLGAVLDFLLTDDRFVTGFCDAAGLAYHRPLRARMQLAGPAATHWT